MIRTFDYFLNLQVPFFSDITPVVLSNSDTEIVTELCNKIIKNPNVIHEIDGTLSSDIYCKIGCELNGKGKSYSEHAMRYLRFSSQCGNLEAYWMMFYNHTQMFSKTDEYKKLVTINSGEANNLIGCILMDEIQFKQAIEYLLRATEQNNKSAMLNLGYYYQTQQVNHTLMKKYYDMVKNHPLVNFLLGMYHSYAEIDYEKVIEYFSKGVDFLNTSFELGHFYSESAEHNKTLLLHGADSYGNKELSMKYYKQWINHSELTETIFNKGVSEIKTLLGNDYAYYQLLKSVPNPQKFIANKITEMERNTDFMKLIYKIKVSTKYEIIESCAICFETRLNIFVNCGHLLCIGCYKKVDKCPMCKELKNGICLTSPRSRSASPSARGIGRRPVRRESPPRNERTIVIGASPETIPARSRSVSPPIIIRNGRRGRVGQASPNSSDEEDEWP